MKTLLRATTMLVPLLGGMASTAAQADDCHSYLNSFYDTSQRASTVFADVQSVRVFHDGNVSVGLSAMPTYSPIWGNAPAAFTVATNPFSGNAGGSVANGDFQDFFPSRMDANLTNLALFRDGRVRITLKDEGNQEFYLQDMQCHGDQYNFMLEGKVNVPPYTSTWAFSIKRFIDRP